MDSYGIRVAHGGFVRHYPSFLPNLIQNSTGDFTGTSSGWTALSFRNRSEVFPSLVSCEKYGYQTQGSFITPMDSHLWYQDSQGNWHDGVSTSQAWAYLCVRNDMVNKISLILTWDGSSAESCPGGTAFKVAFNQHAAVGLVDRRKHLIMKLMPSAPPLRQATAKSGWDFVRHLSEMVTMHSEH